MSDLSNRYRMETGLDPCIMNQIGYSLEYVKWLEAIKESDININLFSDLDKFIKSIHGRIPENIYVDLTVQVSNIKERIHFKNI